MRAPHKPLSLLSLNVNGLNDAKKRENLFFLLRVKRFDVVLLQETHHASEAVGLGWASELTGGVPHWKGPSFWSHGSSQARGVAILFREGSPADAPLLLHNCPEGRLCAVSFSYLGKKHSVFNVYAPSSDDALKQHFFRLSAAACSACGLQPGAHRG